MTSYDIIVIGAGIAGSAIAYELVQKGVSVLLLEQSPIENNHSATRYSYGGLAFWSGTTELTRQLCKEGRSLYNNLSAELDTDIEFRELDLLLTISREDDPEDITHSYQRFKTPAKLLDVNLLDVKLLGIKEACELEPLLNQDAISGALTIKHGHMNPIKTTQAYIKAFLRAGGNLELGSVVDIQSDIQTVDGNSRSVTISTNGEKYYGKIAIVCAGGFSRELLKASFKKSSQAVQIYFTHAEIIETPPLDLKLNTLIMPANLQRFTLEKTSTQSDQPWNVPENKLGWILDAGVVQFLDGSLRIGQISSVFTNPFSLNVPPEDSELALRKAIEDILPTLKEVPGSLRRCLVAFSKDSLPLVGSIPPSNNLYLFSGFSNPLVIIPPLAKRFADFLVNDSKDDIIPQLSPQRFFQQT